MLGDHVGAWKKPKLNLEGKVTVRIRKDSFRLILLGKDGTTGRVLEEEQYLRE